MLKPKELILATNNKYKIVEFERILKPLSIEIISQSQAGINVIPEETANTFEGNAFIKAKTIFDKVLRPVVADDSGIEVYALNNAPGVFSARYGGPELDDVGRYEKMLFDMKDVPSGKRGARYVCAISLVLSAEQYYTFTGVCEGEIDFAPNGENGFGYDPIFLVDTEDGKKSFSSITPKQKDEMSHRGKALMAMADFLQTTLF